jgi:hypothetical protein
MPLREMGANPESFFFDSLVWGMLFMFAFILFGAWFRRRRRARQAAEQARRLGFSALPAPDPAFAARIRRVYAPSANARAANVAWRRRDELTIYLFDVATTRGGRTHLHTSVEEDVLALVSPRVNLPPFLLVNRPAGMDQAGQLVNSRVDLALKQLGLTHGYRQVFFNHSGRLDQRMLLFTNNEEVVKPFFSPALVSFLAQDNGYVLRAVGDMLIVGRFNFNRPESSPDRAALIAGQDLLSGRIDQAIRLYDHILNDR